MFFSIFMSPGKNGQEADGGKTQAEFHPVNQRQAAGPETRHEAGLETTQENGKCWKIYFCIAENEKVPRFQSLPETGCCDAKFHL